MEQSHCVTRKALFPSPALGSSYVYACPALQPSSESRHVPHPQREGATNSAMKWVGRRELDCSPLDFPSLSQRKLHPIMELLGIWAVGVGWGPRCSSHPCLPSCLAAWIRAEMGSPLRLLDLYTQGWLSCWDGHRWALSLHLSLQAPLSWLPCLLPSPAWSVSSVRLGGGEGRQSERLALSRSGEGSLFWRVP